MSFKLVQGCVILAPLARCALIALVITVPHLCYGAMPSQDGSQSGRPILSASQAHLEQIYLVPASDVLLELNLF